MYPLDSNQNNTVPQPVPLQMPAQPQPTAWAPQQPIVNPSGQLQPQAVTYAPNQQPQQYGAPVSSATHPHTMTIIGGGLAFVALTVQIVCLAVGKPLLGTYVAGPLAVIGLIFSVIGLARKDKLAVAPLVASILVLLIGIGNLTVFLVQDVQHRSQQAKQVQASTDSPTPTITSPAPAANPTPSTTTPPATDSPSPTPATPSPLPTGSTNAQGYPSQAKGIYVKSCGTNQKVTEAQCVCIFDYISNAVPFSEFVAAGTQYNKDGTVPASFNKVAQEAAASCLK